MAKLIGSETAVGPLAANITSEKIYACQFTAIAGTVEELALKLGAASGGEIAIGIYRDSGGFPGVLMEQRENVFLTGAEELLKVTGFKAVLSGSTPYWLAAVNTSAPDVLRPIISGTPSEFNERRSLTSVTKLAELAPASWSGTNKLGPEIFYGNGTLFQPHSQGTVIASQKEGGNA